MKRFLCALLIAVMALMVSGCTNNKNQNESSDKRISVCYYGIVNVYRDNFTGVQYIGKPNGGICVLLNPDGTPYTGKWECDK